MSTTIQERAALVLAEIAAALAVAEKQTRGPWVRDGYDIKQRGGREVAYVGPHHTAPRDYPLYCKTEDERNGDGIAAARTLMPASLLCLKTAIEGLLEAKEWNEQRDEDFMPSYAFTILTTLCDQWKEAQP